jgi:beta-1,4-N-acetylglucosaminyltransferase
MIFVTVGTTKFDELVKEVDKIAPRFKEKIIIQIGNGNYRPKNCKYFNFNPELNRYLKNADLIISHGGAGTIFEALNMKKNIICVENPDVNDSHQGDLLKKLEDERYLIWCKDVHDIEGSIALSKKFQYKKYVPQKCTIGNTIIKFLERK